MAELKTRQTDASVAEFLSSVPDDRQREDSLKLAGLMQEITGEPARMWGTSIVGFGNYHYKYASGREGDWFLVGFSPRKRNLTLYIMSGFEEYDQLLGDLGKHSTGKSCLYVRRLDDVNMDTLRALVERSVAHMVATNE